MTRQLTPPADLPDHLREAWSGYARDLRESTGAPVVDVDILTDVMRARHRLEQVQAVLEAEGLTVSGSKGQKRPHPLLVTESVLRREVAQGLDRLGFAPNRRGKNIRVTDAGRLRNPYKDWE